MQNKAVSRRKRPNNRTDPVGRYVGSVFARLLSHNYGIECHAAGRTKLQPLYALNHIFKSTLFPLTEQQKYSVPMQASPVMAAIAKRQMACAERFLLEQFDLPLGLLDPRVSIIVVNPSAFDFPSLMAKETEKVSTAGDASQRSSLLREAFSRMWKLDSEGLTPYEMPPGGGGGNVPSAGRLPCTVVRPLSVILGFLPTWDCLDWRVCESGLLINEYADSTAAEHVEPFDVSPASVARALLLGRAAMPLSGYWTAYADYLKMPRDARLPAPITPGDYRNLLVECESARDQRLRCLKAYTGIHRANADENDVLAGSQAIFFLLVEHLLRKAGKGFASLAADPEFLDHPDAVRLRKRLLAVCDHITIDEMRVDCTGRMNVSSVGDKSLPIALYFMTKTRIKGAGICEARYREHADAKTPGLLFEDHPETSGTGRYAALSPSKSNDYALRPERKFPGYSSWPSLVDLSLNPPIGGLMEKRQGALIDIDKGRLEERMRMYFDEHILWDRLVDMNHGLTVPQARFNPMATREGLLAASGFFEDNIQRYTFKPFDDRWCYHSKAKSLWGEPKPNLAELVDDDNAFIVARSRKAVADEGVPLFFTTVLADTDLLRGHSYCFPLWFLNEKQDRVPNISDRMAEYLTTLDILHSIGAMDAARMVWNHVLAIVFSSAYLWENREGIGQGWPRIPFPGGKDADAATNARARGILETSAGLGKTVAELLNWNVDADDVMRGMTAAGLRNVARAPWDEQSEASGKSESNPDVPVTMNWGKMTTDNAVLPAHGRLGSREFTAAEKQCLEAAAWAVGVHAGGAYFCLGAETFDVHFNDDVCIANIPAKVWMFTVGGYQVLKKWLSYRETSILGRPLIRAEVEEFCQIPRRIAALLLLGPRLNRNYAVVRDLSRPFEGVR